MNKQKTVLLFVILLSTGLAIFFLPNDEKKIKANLGSLAEYCSSGQAEPVIATLQKAAQAAKLCTDPCEVKIESFTIDREFSSKEVTDHIIMMKKRLTGTNFSFEDTVINISGNNRADITTTLQLTGKTVDGRFVDAYEFDITADKIDGEWLFSSFTVVEFMKK
jgi:hypothetical protein